MQQNEFDPRAFFAAPMLADKGGDDRTKTNAKFQQEQLHAVFLISKGKNV